MTLSYRQKQAFIEALRERYLGERGETKEEKLERAYGILESYKHGSHNQASHGFRFGKAPSLSQARQYRKAGVLAEYSKRARERSGTSPAKARNAAKPKPKVEPKKVAKPAADKPKRSVADAKKLVKGRITALGGKKVSFVPTKDGRFRVVAQGERAKKPAPTSLYINKNGEIVNRDGSRVMGF